MAATQTIVGPTPGQYSEEEAKFPAKSTAGGPGVSQTMQTFVGVLTNPTSGNTALGVIPTGKTFFITDIVITTSSASQILIQIEDNTTVIFATHVNQTKGIESMGIESQPTVAGGDTLNLNTPAVTGQVAYNIMGFYQ